MPISEQSIIAPQRLDARAPISKRTIAWLSGLALVLALVGALAPAFIASPAPSRPREAVAAGAASGDPAQIDRELGAAKAQAAYTAQAVQAAQAASARKAAALPPAPAASAGTAPMAPLPSGFVLGAAAASSGLSPVTVVPPRAQRTDQSAALYARSGDGAAVEQEAAARQAPGVKFDASGGDSRAMPGDSQAVLPQFANSTSRGGAAGPAERDRSPERALAALAEAQRPPGPVVGASADRVWLKELGGEVATVAPLRAYRVRHPYTLLQGKLIPAVLTRELNSDLPGAVSACTTVPMYDSLTGEHLLIPRGSCLVGQYSNAIGMGQERILFAFTRLMLPDGTSVDLPGAPGADHGGAAGVGGKVDHHFFRMFGASLLVAILGDRAERDKTIVQSPTQGQGAGGPATAAGQVLVDVSRSLLERHRSLAPTISVPKGTRIHVEVTRDIQFAGAYSARTDR